MRSSALERVQRSKLDVADWRDPGHILKGDRSDGKCALFPLLRSPSSLIRATPIPSRSFNIKPDFGLHFLAWVDLLQKQNWPVPNVCYSGTFSRITVKSRQLGYSSKRAHSYCTERPPSSPLCLSLILTPPHSQHSWHHVWRSLPCIRQLWDTSWVS